ncbi:MAG TPA: YebC/PmpR family DNA-binding transcriptional regulator [Limnochordia bacterium]|nr:YebC/PmpR family DNA-binding transcriptional regulator [Limnochordia bacterium]
MSGHSKWNNIKRKKEKEDARRGAAFTKVARLITVAARAGGGDPDANFRLRLAIDKARAVNMPFDNIERAIKRGSGEAGGDNYDEVVYEGYGPGGVAVLLDIMTDNRNRTASDVRHLFSKYGGNMGEAGCVAWMFEQKGVLWLEPEQAGDLDELMLQALEAGAEDVSDTGDGVEIVTAPGDFAAVKDALEQAGYAFAEASVTMRPKSTVPVEESDAERLMVLLEAFEEHDDIQDVYTNGDFN